MKKEENDGARAHCPNCKRTWKFGHGYQGDMKHCHVCKTELVPPPKEEKGDG